MATTPNIEPKSNGFFNGATELAQYLVSQGKNDAKNELAVNQKLIEIDGVQHYWDSSNLRWRPITAPIPDDEPVPERYVFFTLDGWSIIFARMPRAIFRSLIPKQRAATG